MFSRNAVLRASALVVLPIVLLTPRLVAADGAKEVAALEAAVAARDRLRIPNAMRRLVDADPARALTAVPKACADIEDGETPDDELRFRVIQGAVAALAALPSESAYSDALEKIAKRSKRWPERLVAYRTMFSRARANQAAGGDEFAKRALGDDRPEIVASGAAHLTKTKSVESLRPLQKAMAEWEGRKFESKVLTKYGERTVDIGPLAWSACQRALYELTGASLSTAREYKAYLRSQKDKIDPRSIDIAALEAEARTARTGTSLFGLPLAGRRICFVIDVSGSMLQSDALTPEDEAELAKAQPGTRDEKARELAEGRRRIVRARAALEKSVLALSSEQSFNIIAFASEVKRFDSFVVPATTEKKKAAAEFIAGLSPGGVTVTDEAMYEAFLDPEVDTIFLITDGAPTHMPSKSGGALPEDSRRLMDSILEDTRFANVLRGVRVHTLGFEGAEEQFLRELAEENSGSYVEIR